MLKDNAFIHVNRVLRLKVGAKLILFNGKPDAFAATLTEIGKRAIWARITEVLPAESEPALRIVLAQGISRGEKMDYTVQKAVELGVNAIQPLVADRSVVDVTGERLTRKIQHWRGVMIGACEQCGRNRLPELREPLTLMDWLARPLEPGLRLLLDPDASQGLRALRLPADGVTLLIGPEGGFSATEVERAQAAGFTGIRLGPRVLRTETAGIAALAAIQALWGDWN